MTTASTSERLPIKRVVLAWATHAFTLTGAIWASLAIISLHQGHVKLMWLWLGIALIVDGVDGTFARAANVQKYAPNFDGATLDNIVDFLTWTFIPAAFMYMHVDFGNPTIAMLAMVFVCVSSLFCYCNKSLKTEDYYFMGFPAAWNVVAIIMWIFATGPTLNIILTILLGVLTVVPLTFVHPFRVTWLRPLNIAAAVVWVASTAILVGMMPAQPLWLIIVWWVSGGWIMAISAIRTGSEFKKRWNGSEV